MDQQYLPARVEYLENRDKQLTSENDLLRTSMHQLAAEHNQLMAFYLSFKTWVDTGCPAGDKTHSAMTRAYAQVSA